VPELFHLILLVTFNSLLIIFPAYSSTAFHWVASYIHVNSDNLPVKEAANTGKRTDSKDDRILLSKISPPIKQDLGYTVGGKRIKGAKEKGPKPPNAQSVE